MSIWTHIIKLNNHYFNIIYSYLSFEILNKRFILFWSLLITSLSLIVSNFI